MRRRGRGSQKISEGYSKNFPKPGRRMPVLESQSAYCRIIRPSLIYGFDDGQRSAVFPVTPPVENLERR